MIKILKAEPLDGYTLRLHFSDGMVADYDFSYLLEKGTVLTDALKDPDYFRDYLIDLGALGWKNGLELSPDSLYRKAKERGILYREEEVA